jgi:thiosulfate/3-mercaptopyruvate sulfurtransferase
MGSEAFGIRPDDHIVLYDSYGLFSAPRVYWTFKYFGHPLVSVLRGGLKAWKAEGKPLESGTTRPVFEKTDYKVDAVDEELLIAYDDLLAHVIDFQYPKNYVIVDARSAGR